MSFFGMGSSLDVAFTFKGSEERAAKKVPLEGGATGDVPIFQGDENVAGEVVITPGGKKVDHIGIKIELIGQIELFYDRGNHYEFTSLVRELDPPGTLTTSASYPFEFSNVDKQYESYNGLNVRLRYFLRVTVTRGNFSMNTVKEQDFLVQNVAVEPEINNSIKMEVGIEECLHIEFEYNKSKYHLKDVIVGKIYFLLVRIKIKHMEIAIIKRETTGSGPNTFHENETIAKYEIMDGAPVRGESIPIRVFLAGYDLTPTMRDINKKFSVRYYLNLVLVDEEERRYFKQQEITLWRKGERVRKLPLGSSLYQQQHALARHEAGDQPTEGVRTAPTPSQPPTPFAEGGKPLPGEAEGREGREQGRSEQEAKEKVLSEDRIAEMEDKLCEATEEKLAINKAETVENEAEEKPEKATSAVPDLVPQGEQEAQETDSLKDLDIVAVSEAQCGERVDSPDALDSPPEMPDSPASRGSPAASPSLPSAPTSEPGSPQAQPKKVAVEAGVGGL